MPPTGLLLVNLGTPDDPSPSSVRRYLRQFLSDPRVIDIHPVARFLLLNLVILPTRPKKSAAAYQAIWDPVRGSPLLYHSRDLAAGVAAALGSAWKVELAMRYGSPSIASAVDKLVAAGCTRIVALPLYPQKASSSSDSTADELARVMKAHAGVAVEVVPAFWHEPGFLDAFAAVGRPVLEQHRPDHVVFSFHGLPERHVRKDDPSGRHCLASADCCAVIGDTNRDCYRAQSFATARELATRLGLAAERYSVAFQSRLGRTPWITPHTDVLLTELARRGTRSVAVFCPAFVADCLETVEEIGLRARHDFKAAGGGELVLVPSLNATPTWVEAVATMVRARG